MIIWPVLNLFFYNVLLGYLDWQCRDAIGVITSYADFWPRNSLWHQIPYVDRLVSLFFGYPKSFQEFSDMLWGLNPYVNSLVLLPTIFQNECLNMLLTMILMWNVCVIQRMLSFCIRLAWKLWCSDLCWGYYVLLVGFGTLMNAMHMILIFATVKLPQVQLLRRPSDQ